MHTRTCRQRGSILCDPAAWAPVDCTVRQPPKDGNSGECRLIDDQQEGQADGKAQPSLHAQEHSPQEGCHPHGPVQLVDLQGSFHAASVTTPDRSKMSDKPPLNITHRSHPENRSWHARAGSFKPARHLSLHEHIPSLTVAVNCETLDPHPSDLAM